LTPQIRLRGSEETLQLRRSVQNHGCQQNLHPM